MSRNKHLFLFVAECQGLDGYIQDYDTTNYNTKLVHREHTRLKRYSDHIQHLELQAFGRNLLLELKKDRSVFTNDHRSELSNGSLIDDDLSFLYSGNVKGIPGSRCHGSLIQGIFQGSIHLPDETFHIEKSTRFFNGHPGFHSVIYRESDLRYNLLNRNSTEPINDVTGIQTMLKDRMKTMQVKEKSNQRSKRAVQTLGTKNTCNLYLRSDPLLWTRYLQKSGGNREVARQEIIATFASHVHAVNNILDKTTFQTYDGSIGYHGIQLAIARIRIMTDDDCQGPSPSPYCTQYMDADNFLNLVSTEKYDLFCLAYAFTYRDFASGVLGKTWIPSTDGVQGGGICDKFRQYLRNGRAVFSSLNTGMITMVNYNIELPPRISHLNFAHQIGHSLGSLNDKGSVCAPYGTSGPNSEQGNYIMFDGSISGDRENNDKFSVCSRDNIARVLDHVLHSPGRNCFIENVPFCGNQIVEKGEECDCGFIDECEESCCIPRNPNGTTSDMCKLKAGKVCSPSQGPCCSDTCQHVTACEKTCSPDNECNMASYCTGSSSLCPEATNKPDGSFCGDFTYICQCGECSESLCEKIGWKQCFVTQSDGNADDMCTLACVQNGSSSQGNCIMSSDVMIDSYPEYKQLVDEIRTGRQAAGLSVPQKGILLHMGSPCNNYLGYCDAFHKCRLSSHEMINPIRNETGQLTTVPGEGETTQQTT